MICPNCGTDNMQSVISTRRRSPEYILRRRECECGFRFNTVEIAELNEDTLRVIEREMRHNSKVRAFEKIINLAYRKIFDRTNYLKEKKLERDAG